MERWMAYAWISMVFAGFTSVLGKQGLAGISGELGLTVRTVFVFGFVLLFAAWAVPREQLATLTRDNLFWLGLSSLTTALSWIFYYQALKAGDVPTVALIDKGSVVVALVLAWLILGEHITLRAAGGCALIVVGLLIITRK